MTRQASVVSVEGMARAPSRKRGVKSGHSSISPFAAMEKPTRSPSALSIYRPGLFNGKVAIVTGGGTGIGKSIAYELAFLGCTVVIASRDFERLKSAADKIQVDMKAANPASAGLLHPIACNIRSEEQVSNLVDETLTKFKRVDFLVNNAGGQFRSLLEDVSLNGWQAVMNTNLNGTFLMTKKVYHAYMKEHGGSIVNIIILLDKGHPGLAHSAAARAGIESLSKSLSVEWAASGVTLNCVAPGIILSSGVENYPNGAELFVHAAQKATTAKRMGSVEEVSASVLYYLSPASAYVTGDTMHVDGGWHLLGPLLDVPSHDNNHPYGTSKM